MTAEQAATLKRLAEAGYDLSAFKPNLTHDEADQRIAILTASSNCWTSRRIHFETCLARLQVLAVIPATIVLMLASAIGGVALSLPWGTIALAVIAAATLLQSSYMIGGLLSDAPSPRAVPRISLRPDLLRIAQFG